MRRGQNSWHWSPYTHLQASTDDINLVPFQIEFRDNTFCSNVLSALNMSERVSKMPLNHWRCANTFNETERGTLRWMDVRRGNFVNAWCNELYQAINEFGHDLMGDEHYFVFIVWWQTNSRCAVIKVVEILIKGIAIQLNGHNFFNGRIRYPKGFLEALQDALTVLVGVLDTIYQNITTEELEYQPIWHPPHPP